MQPPAVIQFNASNVPVAQLNVFSDTLSAQQLFDYGLDVSVRLVQAIQDFFNAIQIGRIEQVLAEFLEKSGRAGHAQRKPPLFEA